MEFNWVSERNADSKRFFWAECDLFKMFYGCRNNNNNEKSAKNIQKLHTPPKKTSY